MNFFSLFTRGLPGGTIKEIVAEISKQKKRGTKNKKQKWVVPGLIPCETSALCGSYLALSASNPHEKNEKSKMKKKERRPRNSQTDRGPPAGRAAAP